MPKCRCESRDDDSRKRIKKLKPQGKGLTRLVVCLDCHWEWWTASERYKNLQIIDDNEKQSISR